MNNHMQTIKRLCEVGKLATKGNWGYDEDTLCMLASFADEIGDSAIHEGCYEAKDDDFIAEAANARPSIQWAQDRIETLEAALREITGHALWLNMDLEELLCCPSADAAKYICKAAVSHLATIKGK